MFSRLFTCCDDLQSIDRNQLKHPFQKRASRFIQVTTDPLTRTAGKIPLDGMSNNKTYTFMNGSNTETKDSNSLRSTRNQNVVNQSREKPATPIVQLTSLIDSNVFYIKSANKNL